MALHTILIQLLLLVVLTAYLTAAMPICGKNVLLERLKVTTKLSQERLQPSRNLSDLIGRDCNEEKVKLYCGVIVLHQFAQQLNESMVSKYTQSCIIG